jgi:tetratricopeptide (TPR) repeat protein
MIAELNLPLLIGLILVALAFDLLNGVHDTANSIATLVSTRMLRPRYAVIWAAFFNFIAFLVFGVHVARTVGVGIVSADVMDAHVIFGALMGAISWNLITWWAGIPSLNRANSLVDLERLGEALVMCGKVLSANPTQPEALNSRGVALGKLGRYDEALASYDGAVALRPKFVEAHSNRGTALHELNRHAEALASYDRALALRLDYAEALANRGNALKELRRFDEALASYERALELRPHLADGHFSAATCRLLIGDFARGWQQHEWRWETAQLRAAKRHFLQPLWIGADDIAGKTILLHAEQGFGDTLQFCRYVPRVAERGGTSF